MRKSALSVTAVLVLGLWIGALALVQGARAQTYPPPVGSLSVEAASTTPGSTTDVTATVLDNDGNPVEGAVVTFRIVSQPGSDAHWADGGLETTAITNAIGVATAVLTAGSDPGSIIIETISGEQTSQVTVSVVAEAPAGGLPPTGASPGGDSGVPTWQIAFLAAGGALLAGAFFVMTRRGRRGA